MKVIYNDKLLISQLENMFSNDDLCLDFLAQLKWNSGFVCRKCNNDNSCDGKVPFSRRCTRCKNEESATANTLFHNLKFPVSKAFYIAYEVCKNIGKNMSTYDLSTKLDLRQVTCWNFKNKVEDKINRLLNRSENGSILMTDVLVGNIDSPFN